MDILAAFETMGDRIDGIIRQTDKVELRVPQLAAMLRDFWPSSPLYACLLQAGTGYSCGVLDQSGQRRDAWAELLRPCLKRMAEIESKQTVSGKLPPPLKLAGYSLIGRAVAGTSEPDAPARETLAGASGSERYGWGVLALAVPKNAGPETLAEVGTLLAVSSEQLALRLQAEALEQRLGALQLELEGQSALASAGELAGPLTHEFNNFLNIVLLHVALLETEIAEKLRSELIELRRQGAGMTGLVKQFQHYRRRLHLVPLPADVNHLVQEAVTALAGSPPDRAQGLVIKLPPSSRIEITGLSRPASVPLDLALADDLPLIMGSPADIKRLCTFLLTNAAAAAGSVGGSVLLRTDFTDSHVFLRVEDTGPSVSPDLLHQIFEPTTAGRPGTNSLELAACDTLVRRLQGRIRSENRPEGGVVVTVELPRMAS
jgi:signal transduction histidine kinase